jgi:hypothetical protein
MLRRLSVAFSEIDPATHQLEPRRDMSYDAIAYGREASRTTTDVLRTRSRFLDRGGCPPQRVCNLEDMSPSGCKLLIEHPISEGTSVTLQCKGQEYSGSVRYCRSVEIGFDIGIAFTERGAWDCERYEPRAFFGIWERRLSRVQFSKAGGTRNAHRNCNDCDSKSTPTSRLKDRHHLFESLPPIMLCIPPL